MRESVEKLLNRYGSAMGRQTKYKELFKSCYQYAMPNRDIWDDNKEGQSKTQKVFDSTAMNAVDGFVNSMITNVTPAYSRWFELTAGELVEPQFREELQEALNKVNDVLVAALNSTNFNTSVSEMYYDLACGTGCLMVLDNDDLDKPFEFIAVPQAQIGLEEGKFGSIGAVFRTHRLQANLIEQTWKDAKLSDTMKQKTTGNPTAEISLIEATYYNPKDDNWYYDVIVESDKERLVERTYKENPFIVVRWSKVAGEVFGRGTLTKALPDIKMLNKQRELAIRSAQLNAFGVYTVADNGIINVENLKIEPAGFIPVSRNAGPNGPSIAPLPMAGNPSIAENDMQRLQFSVKETLLDNRLTPEVAMDSTKYSVQQLLSFYQSDLASSFGRIMNELINPLVKRITGILLRKGIIRLPEIPILNPETGEYVKIKIDNKNIDNLFLGINILSPIARLRQLEDVNITVQGIQTALLIDPTGGQQTMSVIDYPATIKWILDKMGVPEELTRDDQEQALYDNEKKQQAIQEQAVLAQIQQAGKAQ